jgi:hypothetical protein
VATSCRSLLLTVTGISWAAGYDRQVASLGNRLRQGRVWLQAKPLFLVLRAIMVCGDGKRAVATARFDGSACRRLNND